MNVNNLDKIVDSNLRMGNVYCDHQLAAFREGPDPILSLPEENIQPASIDIGIDPHGYTYPLRVMPPITPGLSIANILKLNEGYGRYRNDSCPTLLTNHIYLIEMEGLIALKAGMRGYFSPKSTSGRLDLYCAILSEGAPGFDELAPEYAGKLYMVIIPQGFPIITAPGETFSQLRLYSAERLSVSGDDLRIIHDSFPLVHGCEPVFTNKGLLLHLDLTNEDRRVVAASVGRPIDVRKRGYYDPAEYFQTKRLDPDGYLHLDDREFMLGVTRERVSVPGFLCAVMVPQHEARGPFRAHNAGFIDPGYGGSGGEWLTCEIRNLAEFPISFIDGQIVALLRFERLRALPKELYGQTVSAKEPAHYQNKRVYPKQFI